MLKNVLENAHVQANDRIRCVAIIGYILSAYPSKIVIDHLNILLAPEVNKLVAYLNETSADQVEIQLYLFNHYCIFIRTSLYGNKIFVQH